VSFDPTSIAHRMPWTAAAGAAVVPATVAWSDAPALPPAVAAAIAGTWGVRIVTDAAAPAALDHPSPAAVVAAARAEQVTRALSHRTNLVLPGSRAIVTGHGSLADALADVFRRAGARVIRATDDAAATLGARLRGVETRTLEPATWPEVDTVVIAGPHPALEATRLSGVVIDATLGGVGLAPAAGSAARPGVTEAAEATWVVEAPPPFAPDPDAASALEWRIADAFTAVSLLAAESETGTTAIDTRFAGLVIA
jgi:hypothetical protein